MGVFAMADVATIPEILVAANFWIEINNMLEAFFEECDGLEVKTEFYEYKEGGLNTHSHKFPTRTTYGNLSLRRGFSESKKLWEWYKKTQDGTPELKNISIIVYSGDNPGTPVRRWNFTGAYPISWKISSFTVKNSEHLIESVEIVYKTMEVAI
jgi:phage tail-like protein